MAGSLDLSAGKLVDYGMDKLCGELERGLIHVETLNLSNNSLVDSDAKRLGKAMVGSPDLKSVDLRGNMFSTLAGFYMFKAIGEKCRMVCPLLNDLEFCGMYLILEDRLIWDC